MRMKLWMLALGALLLAGCATTAPPTVPRGYSGPIAYLKDSGRMESGTKGQLFYLAEIDGQAVFSSLAQTQRDNHGRGMSLALSLIQHTVPARPLRLKLIATHITGAPIHEMAARAGGTYFETSREISFTPAPNGEYRVAGRLQGQGFELWIEDLKTKGRVAE